MDGFDLIGELPSDPTTEDYYLPDMLRGDGYTVIPPPDKIQYMDGGSVKEAATEAKNPPVVVYIVEGKDYIDMLAVSLNSMLRHYSGPGMAVFVYCKQDDYQYVVSSVSEVEPVGYGSKVFVAIMPEAFMGLLHLSARNTHLGDFCCARFLIPDLLPYSSACLYLDSDVIFHGDVLPLLRDVAPGPGFDLVAGADPIRPDRPYYNSGVLVMNLDSWRRKHLKDVLFAKVIEKKYRFLDQDCINDTCSIARFDSKYNLLSIWSRPEYLERYNQVNGTSFDSPEAVVENAVALHFTGPGKFSDGFDGSPMKAVLDEERKAMRRPLRGPSGRVSAVARSFSDIYGIVSDRNEADSLSSGDSLLYLPQAIDERIVKDLFLTSVDDQDRLCVAYTGVFGDGAACVKLSNKSNTMLFRPENPILFNGPVLLEFFKDVDPDKLSDTDYLRWFWNHKTNYGWKNNYKVYLTKKNEDE